MPGKWSLKGNLLHHFIRTTQLLQHNNILHQTIVVSVSSNSSKSNNGNNKSDNGKEGRYLKSNNYRNFKYNSVFSLVLQYSRIADMRVATARSIRQGAASVCFDIWLLRYEVHMQSSVCIFCKRISKSISISSNTRCLIIFECY